MLFNFVFKYLGKHFIILAVRVRTTGKFTFFNVENADEIVADNVKPRVTEKGAFAYREV